MATKLQVIIIIKATKSTPTKAKVTAVMKKLFPSNLLLYIPGSTLLDASLVTRQKGRRGREHPLEGVPGPSFLSASSRVKHQEECCLEYTREG